MKSDREPAVSVGRASRTLLLLCVVGLAAVLSGCAFSYVDKNGDTHYRGVLVHVVVQKADDKQEVRAESVRVKTFGLSLLSGLQRTNFTLGYNDDTMTLTRGNTCIVSGRSSQGLSFMSATMSTQSTEDDSNERQ